MIMIAKLLLTVIASATLHADDWPQWLGPKRDGVWRESGIVKKFPEGGPSVRWRMPIGSGYGGPAVAHGRVYVTDRKLAPSAANPENSFTRAEIPGVERVLCLDAATGKELWKHEYDSVYTVSYASGPRTTPAIDDGLVYTLGAEGDLVCLNADTGAKVWAKNFKQEFNVKTPIWGFASNPLIDGNKVICLASGEGSVAVAFDKKTGKELWRSLSAKEPGYSSPMIHEFAGKRQLIIWHPQAVNSLDPETGRTNWIHETRPVNYNTTIASPVKSGDTLFVSSFYNGSLMLRVTNDTPAVLWASRKMSEKDTEALHTVMATPLIQDGHIYGPCSYGQFRCLKEETGERLWETFAPTSGKSERWGHAFVIKHEDRVFLFSEKGDLIIAKLTPEKYEEISRANLLPPNNRDAGRPVVWSHPAFANKSIYARNDNELLCADLAAK
jgi:outer membrane protein assembly factor BamB